MVNGSVNREDIQYPESFIVALCNNERMRRIERWLVRIYVATAMSNALHTQRCVKQHGCVMAHPDFSIPEFFWRLNPDATAIGFIDFLHVCQTGSVSVYASISERGEPFQNGFDVIVEKSVLSGCSFAIVPLRPQWTRAEFVDFLFFFHDTVPYLRHATNIIQL